MDDERKRELDEMLGTDPELEWSHAEHAEDGDFVEPEAPIADLEIGHQHDDDDQFGPSGLTYVDVD